MFTTIDPRRVDLGIQADKDLASCAKISKE
jgi:hypothetical protein